MFLVKTVKKEKYHEFLNLFRSYIIIADEQTDYVSVCLTLPFIENPRYKIHIFDSLTLNIYSAEISDYSVIQSNVTNSCNLKLIFKNQEFACLRDGCTFDLTFKDDDNIIDVNKLTVRT